LAAQSVRSKSLLPTQERSDQWQFRSLHTTQGWAFSTAGASPPSWPERLWVSVVILILKVFPSKIKNSSVISSWSGRRACPRWLR